MKKLVPVFFLFIIIFGGLLAYFGYNYYQYRNFLTYESPKLSFKYYKEWSLTEGNALGEDIVDITINSNSKIFITWEVIPSSESDKTIEQLATQTTSSSEYNDLTLKTSKKLKINDVEAFEFNYELVEGNLYKIIFTKNEDRLYIITLGLPNDDYVSVQANFDKLVSSIRFN